MVYVDILVIIDLLFNYIILLTVGVLLNRIVHFKDMFLASVVGTINLVFIFININKIVLLLTAIVFSILMSLITFKYKDIIYTLKNVGYMYLCGIFYAGFIYLINTNIFPNIRNEFMYLILLIIIIPVMTVIYIKSIKNISVNHSKYYYVDIYFNEVDRVEVIGFLDTGNKLIEPYGGRPIILLKEELVKGDNLNKILVPYNTVNNHNLLECVVPKKIEIKGVGLKRRVAVGLVKDVNIEGVDCVLNEKLL